MVSLLKLAEITEEGVKFRSPYDDSECMLTPEHSIKIQVGTQFIQFYEIFYVYCVHTAVQCGIHSVEKREIHCHAKFFSSKVLIVKN